MTDGSSTAVSVWSLWPGQAPTELLKLSQMAHGFRILLLQGQGDLWQELQSFQHATGLRSRLRTVIHELIDHGSCDVLSLAFLVRKLLDHLGDNDFNPAPLGNRLTVEGAFCLPGWVEQDASEKVSDPSDCFCVLVFLHLERNDEGLREA